MPSASSSAVTKSKGADAPSHEPAPEEDVDEELDSMKLLGPGIGWAERSVRHHSPEYAEKTVYWTTDNGKHWKNVTPPFTRKENLADLFFLDLHHGWAIFEPSEYVELAEDKLSRLQLVLAATSDAGATWSKTPFTLRLEDYLEGNLSILNEIEVEGIAFADQLHGWLQLSYWVGMHGQGGLLLVTSDGGKTWRKASNYPGPKGPHMRLVRPDEGWVFGSVEPDGSPNSFFVTRDGAKTWQQFSAMRRSQLDGEKEWHEVSILPPGVSEDTNCEVYRLPLFQDSTNGFFAEDCTDETVDTRQISEHTTVDEPGQRTGRLEIFWDRATHRP